MSLCLWQPDKQDTSVTCR